MSAANMTAAGGAAGNMTIAGTSPPPLVQTQQQGWMGTCNTIQFALLNNCADLVNPDNTLTFQGMHVRDCIQGGALLAGAALLLGTPPTTIVSVLPTIAQLGGCGDVVDWSKLTLGQLKGFGQLFQSH
jgi:hypothetical protein